MKSIARAALAAALLVAVACGRHPAPAPPVEAAASSPGVVVLPADSPMLKQIGCARVRAADLPTDELIAPGKIEANPPAGVFDPPRTFTRMSIPPRRSRTRCAAVAQPAAVVRSTAM